MADRAGESGVDFDDFVQKMTADGTELAPWQWELAKRALAGERISFSAPRMPHKRQALVLTCAIAEATNQSWDVLGVNPEQERHVRREARELAARLTDGR